MKMPIAKMITFTMLICAVLMAYCAVINANEAPSLETFEAAVSEAAKPDDTIVHVKGMEISAGLTKQYESTFDSMRTIVGLAPENCSITIAVYQYNDKDEQFSLAKKACVVVGKSGVFSKTIDLETGRNYVLVTAECGEQKTVLTAVLNRKNSNIKKELEQGVVMQGKNLLT